MVLREDSVRRYLLELDTVAAELERYRGVSADDLRGNLSLRWTVERGLLAGLTVIFGVADHILASVFHRYPERYEDALTELQACGVISARLRKDFLGAGGFRDVLAHEYAEIDLNEVVRVLSHAPESFRRFAREVEEWLRSRA